jgi:secreted PhoX family phosphatase
MKDTSRSKGSVDRETEKTMSEIIDARLSRRTALKAFLAAGLFSALNSTALGPLARSARAATGQGHTTLKFKEISSAIGDSHAVAPGYTVNLLIRWGDRVMGDAPEFDVYHQTQHAQERQFGYNNDFVGYFPLPAGSTNSDHGLLCINHEYTESELMFPGSPKSTEVTKEQADIELAAHGHTVIEIKKVGGKWTVVNDGPYNRRITAHQTRMRISGPAAGHARLKTAADPTGNYVIGTLNNCTGGKTPWGTALFAEENFDGYFGGDPEKTSEAQSYKRYGLRSKSRYSWSKYYDRFNVEKTPNEPNRFGWMVEFDPYTPNSMPVKRTALGRFKHEGATTIVNKDGSVVVYAGDDERFDYLYKFITYGRFDPNNRDANRDLLDSGTLFVAKFHENGELTWLPLVWGASPLTPENGFHSQADVLIEARRAADALGATPMDRPEEVEPDAVNGRVYAAFTNNTSRKPEQVDKANPRSQNAHGHILELIPPGGTGKDVDHAALKFRWEVFLLAGNPRNPADKAKYHPALSQHGWLSSPDNLAVDNRGRLWISTDQGSNQAKNGIVDGMWATDVDGPGRSLTKLFFACPRGAEMCGPEFTPDNKTLFLAVQHPGEDEGSSFEKPATRWPDFKPNMPPRPTVVAITKDNGGEIGS